MIKFFNFYKNFSIRDKILFLFGSLLILCTCLIHINELNGIHIINDEIGYWSNTANLLGYSWKNVCSQYYSYGYSLLLIPIFFITDNVSVMYKLAIIENAFLLLFSYFLYIKIIFNLEYKIKNYFVILVSILSSCCSSYIFQAHIAWSEIFVYTWFVFTLYVCLKFLKEKSEFNIFIFSFCIGFLYIIHNRTLSVVISAFLFLLFLFIKCKIKLNVLLKFIFIISVIFLINHYVKIYLSELMWDIPNGFHGNDISSNIKNFSLLLSFSGLITLIKSFLGKLWYLNISTFGIFTFAIIYIIKCTYKSIKQDNTDYKNYFMFFLFFCVLGTLFISTISMNDVQNLLTGKIRIDPIFYGRYSDMLTGISIVFGIFYLNESIIDRKYIYCICPIFITLIATCFCFSRINIQNIYVNTLCVSGIYFFKKFNFLLYSFISIILFIIVYFIFLLKNKYRIIIFFIFIYLVNFIVFENSYYLAIKLSQNYMYENFMDVSSFLNNNLKYSIYIYENKNHHKDYVNNRKLRAYVPNGKLFYCDNLKNIKEDEYFFITNDFDKKYLEKNFYIYTNDSPFEVFAHGENLIKKIESQGYNCFYLSNILKYYNFDIYLNTQKVCIQENKKIKIDIKFLCEKNLLLINANDYKLSYHIYDEYGKIILWDNKRYDIKKVYNGLEFEMLIDSQILKNKGKYIIEIDMVEENVVWFLSKNGKSKKIYLEVL